MALLSKLRTGGSKFAYNPGRHGPHCEIDPSDPDTTCSCGLVDSLLVIEEQAQLLRPRWHHDRTLAPQDRQYCEDCDEQIVRIRKLEEWQKRAARELVRLVSIVEGWNETAKLIAPHGQSGHPARGLIYEVDRALLGDQQ